VVVVDGVCPQVARGRKHSAVQGRPKLTPNPKGSEDKLSMYVRVRSLTCAFPIAKKTS
jgi:hypothetical protein